MKTPETPKKTPDTLVSGPRILTSGPNYISKRYFDLFRAGKGCQKLYHTCIFVSNERVVILDSKSTDDVGTREVDKVVGVSLFFV